MKLLRRLTFFSKPTLRYSLVDKFNDPFELQCSVNCVANKVQMFTKIKEIYLPVADIEKNINYYMEKLPEICQKSFLICCLNNDPLGLLLWAHYAKSHKGFLIEYKFPLDTEESALPLKVNYESTYPSMKANLEELINLFSGNINNKLFKELTEKMFLNKSNEWKYEEEYRYVVPKDKYMSENIKGFTFDESKNFIYEEIKPENISSIVLGVNNINNEELIHEQLKKFNPNINIYRAERSKNEYKLIVPNHPRLGS